jgi:hypothetical protein
LLAWQLQRIYPIASKQRGAPGAFTSTGITNTLKPPQCSRRPDGQD